MLIFLYILHLQLKNNVNEKIYKGFLFDAVLYKTPISYFYTLTSIYKDHPILKDLIPIYLKAKKITNNLKKIIYKWRQRKYKAYDCNTTLSLTTSLNDIDEKYKITLIHKKTAYKFYLFDLHRIWNLALKNSEEMMIKPLTFKNPFNNLDFTYVNLFQIYNKFIESRMQISLYIHHFFKSCNFDIEMFKVACFPLLKDNAINQFLNSKNYDLFYSYLINLNEDFSNKMNYIVLEELYYLKNRVKIYILLKDELAYYLRYKFSSNIISRQYHYTLLCECLSSFDGVKSLIEQVMIMDKKEYIENTRERLFATSSTSTLTLPSTSSSTSTSSMTSTSSSTSHSSPTYTRQSDEEMDVDTEYIPPFTSNHELPRTPRRPTRLPPIPPESDTNNTTINIPTVTVNLNDLQPPPSPPPLTFPPDSDDDF